MGLYVFHVFYRYPLAHYLYEPALFVLTLYVQPAYPHGMPIVYEQSGPCEGTTTQYCDVSERSYMYL